MTYWKRYGNLPTFIRRFEEAIYRRNSSNYEHCIMNTRQNVAIVNFQIVSSENDLIIKIVKTPRVTTADILSNIGALNATYNILIRYFNYINDISLLNFRRSHGPVYRI